MKDERGAELVEFAVVLPMLVMLLIGMFWFGRMMNVWETMTRAAKEGANYSARAACATCSLPCPGGIVMKDFPCPDATVDKTVMPALNASSVKYRDLVAIPKPNFPSCANDKAGCSAANATCSSYHGDGKIWVCYCVYMNPGVLNVPECGTNVSMAYPWKFSFPFTGLDNATIRVRASAQARQEF